MNVTRCTFHACALTARDFPDDGLPEVAIVGRSNVGKSTLLNRLVGVRGLARASKTPGRTRAIHFYRVNDWMYFVDLPGYGFARVPRRMRAEWRGLVEAYLGRTGRVTLALHLVDARHGPTEGDRELAGWLRARGVRCLVVLTKIDKLSGNRRTAAVDRWAGDDEPGPSGQACVVSALTGEGIPALWRVIDRACAESRERSAIIPRVRRGGISGIGTKASARRAGAKRRRGQAPHLTTQHERRRIEP